VTGRRGDQEKDGETRRGREKEREKKRATGRKGDERMGREEKTIGRRDITTNGVRLRKIVTGWQS